MSNCELNSYNTYKPLTTATGKLDYELEASVG